MHHDGYFDERAAARYDESAAEMFTPAIVEPVVDLIAGLAGDGRALELGVGTGRIALPRDENDDDFVLLRPRNGIGPNLSLDRHRSSVQLPPRIHLDLYADDQAAEVARLIGLGATEVHWDGRPPGADYIILADPEGNRLCVVDTA